MKFHLPFIVGGLLAMSSSAFAMSLNYQEVGYNIEARGARAVVAELEKSGNCQRLRIILSLVMITGLLWHPN